VYITAYEHPMGALNSTEQTLSALHGMLRMNSTEESSHEIESGVSVMNNSNHAEERDTQLADVLILLANFHSSNIKIPLFLIVDILNYAGVVPPVVAHTDDSFRSGNECNEAYLGVELPRSKYVTPSFLRVTAVSRDQGWSSFPGERGKRTSHTWGELMLSSDASVRYPFFRNLHAGTKLEHHERKASLLEGSTREKYQELRDAIVAASRPLIGRRWDPLVASSESSAMFFVLSLSIYFAMSIRRSTRSTGGDCECRSRGPVHHGAVAVPCLEHHPGRRQHRGALPAERGLGSLRGGVGDQPGPVAVLPKCGARGCYGGHSYGGRGWGRHMRNTSLPRHTADCACSLWWIKRLIISAYSLRASVLTDAFASEH
jgi:hypothetical protein